MPLSIAFDERDVKTVGGHFCEQFRLRIVFHFSLSRTFVCLFSGNQNADSGKNKFNGDVKTVNREIIFVAMCDLVNLRQRHVQHPFLSCTFRCLVTYGIFLRHDDKRSYTCCPGRIGYHF
jgi:hypothetical protein